MLKNSLKVLLGNIGISWKILIYKLLITLCVLGLATVVMMPIISELIKENFFAETVEVINKVTFTFNLQNLFNNIFLLFNKMFTIINAANLTILAIVAGVSLLILYYFINGLYKISVAENLYAYMASYAKLGFLSCFVSNIKKSVLYCLVRLVTTFIVDVIIIVICILIFISMQNMVSIATLLIMITLVILFGLKNTVFCGWETAICVHGCSVLEALYKSIRACFKKFLRIWSENIIIMLFILAINVFIIFGTMGVGLIITIPLTSLLYSCYNSVEYFEGMGMRYYLDSNNIFSPNKLEEQDKFNKVKDII